MPTVGQGEIATLTVQDGDNTTAATLAVIRPDRTTATTITAVTADGGVTWQATVGPYSVAGLWFHAWTVTGVGAGIAEIPVAVEPRQATVAAPRSYASTTQLAVYLGPGEPIPDDAEGKLGRATVRIDRLLLAAVYPVDEDGEPTDVAHQTALAEAVCELVAFWLDMGDETGFLAGGGSASVGSISLSRSGGKGGNVGGLWVPAHAIAILQNAGLWGHAPWVC